MSLRPWMKLGLSSVVQKQPRKVPAVKVVLFDQLLPNAFEFTVQENTRQYPQRWLVRQFKASAASNSRSRYSLVFTCWGTPRAGWLPSKSPIWRQCSLLVLTANFNLVPRKWNCTWHAHLAHPADWGYLGGQLLFARSEPQAGHGTATPSRSKPNKPELAQVSAQSILSE